MLRPYAYIQRCVRWVVFSRRTNKVVLRYKSGQRQVVRCRDLSVRKDGGQVTSITIENSYPVWVAINVNQLESVWLT